MGLTKLANIEVDVSDDTPLNRSKGVIRTRELDDTDEAEIVDELRSQGVIAAKRMIIRKNDRLIRTGTYILTFGLPTVPSRIRLGYTIVGVDVFIPSPLRCFKCQRFGHGQNSCRGNQVVVSQFNGTSTPKGSYSAKIGDNDCNVSSSRYSLSTALCESNSLSGQV